MNNKGRQKALTLENWKEYVGIHNTKHSITDKLTGIDSLNTNCRTCENCIFLHNKGLEQKIIKDALKKEIEKQENRIKRQMQKEESKRNLDIINDATAKRKELVHKINKIKVLVCAYCFANNLMSVRKNLETPLNGNTDILTKRVLEESEIPFINRVCHRFESFGDLHNVTQAINYIKIAEKNPHCTFAWWSKRPNLIEKAMQELNISELPNNIVAIFSSYYVNEINTEIHKRYPFIQIVFTVFDKYYLEEHEEIEIHCGSRQCLACLKCYTRKEKGTITYINELVK